MRVIEVSMEQRRDEMAGETGDPQENPPTNGIVQHDSHVRKSGDRTRIALVRGEQANREYETAPECKGRGNDRSPRRPANQRHSRGAIPTCENPGAAPPGIEPGSPFWEASSLATTLPWPPLTCYCNFFKISLPPAIRLRYFNVQIFSTTRQRIDRRNPKFTLAHIAMREDLRALNERAIVTINCPLFMSLKRGKWF
ncbi:hypothetical protein PR048_033499 [Dryococelus australis]|uniref:Uncharacterized protein n=1 Tax=Dryococelus australis TaxID=614101 RepID=A0ABQ9G0F5_9NEOP|nr:hypothetical protein PR048_033499 [Dryococelus australis]